MRRADADAITAMLQYEVDVGIGRGKPRHRARQLTLLVVALGAHVEMMKAESLRVKLAEEALAPFDKRLEHVEAGVVGDVLVS